MISSKLEELDNLNVIYKWLPNSTTIRPDPVNLTFKTYRLNQIKNEWITMEDYIRYKIFGQKANLNTDNKKFIKNKNLIDSLNSELVSEPFWIFDQSEFKYNLICILS